MQDIESIVESVKILLADYGLSPGTIDMQYYAIYKPVINRHHEIGVSEYSEEIVATFFDEYKERLEAHTVTRSYFSTVRRSIQHLDSCAKTGVVDFTPFERPFQIIPSPAHLRMVNDCLEGQNIGDEKNVNLQMRHFFCFMEQRIPEDEPITDELVREFILEECSKYSGSIGCILRAVRIIVPYLRTKGLMTGTADYTAFTPKAPRTKMQVPYSPEEVEAMLDALGTTAIDVRNKAMLLLGYDSGLRAGDIIKLTLDDIDWSKGEVAIVQGKTAEPLWLPIHPTTMNAVADYILKARPMSEYRTVFLTVARPYRPLASGSSLSVMMAELSKKVGIELVPGRAFHGVRRSFAINLAEADVPLETISQMLGHKDFSTDRQYLTFNRTQTSMCAMGFELVPLASEYYLSDVSQTGGGQK